jgi:hypothetical protein
MVTRACASRRVRQMLAVFYFFGHPLVQSRQCQIQGARRWITHVKWKEQRDCCILKRRKKGHQVNCPYTEVKKEPKTLDYKEALSVVGMISHTHQPFHRCSPLPWFWQGRPTRRPSTIDWRRSNLAFSPYIGFYEDLMVLIQLKKTLSKTINHIHTNKKEKNLNYWIHDDLTA